MIKNVHYCNSCHVEELFIRIIQFSVSGAAAYYHAKWPRAQILIAGAIVRCFFASLASAGFCNPIPYFIDSAVFQLCFVFLRFVFNHG